MAPEREQKWRQEIGDRAPKAGLKGDYQFKTRLMVVRDGIGDCLGYLPHSMGAVEAYLQKAWCLMEEAVRRADSEEPPNWQRPLL